MLNNAIAISLEFCIFTADNLPLEPRNICMNLLPLKNDIIKLHPQPPHVLHFDKSRESEALTDPIPSRWNCDLDNVTYATRKVKQIFCLAPLREHRNVERLHCSDDVLPNRKNVSVGDPVPKISLWNPLPLSLPVDTSILHRGHQEP